jgi:hypothetical protein
VTSVFLIKNINVKVIADWITPGPSSGKYVLMAGKMIYVDSALVSLVFVSHFWFELCFQTTLIKSVQTCSKLNMRLLTPLLDSQVATMVPAIFGNF